MRCKNNMKFLRMPNTLACDIALKSITTLYINRIKVESACIHLKY